MLRSRSGATLLCQGALLQRRPKPQFLRIWLRLANAEAIWLAAERSSQLLSGTFTARLKLYRDTKVRNTRWYPRADQAVLPGWASLRFRLLSANADQRFSSRNSSKLTIKASASSWQGGKDDFPGCNCLSYVSQIQINQPKRKYSLSFTALH